MTTMVSSTSLNFLAKMGMCIYLATNMIVVGKMHMNVLEKSFVSKGGITLADIQFNLILIIVMTLIIILGILGNIFSGSIFKMGGKCK